MITAGDKLIAKPFSQDGYFKRSIIYLCEDNKEGSLGFIVNKSHGMVLRDIFPHLKNGNFPLYEGGPVSPNQLFYTHTLGTKLIGSVHIIDDVYWGGNFYELSKLIEADEVISDQIRFYIGYSGWGKNQLTEEMENDMWFSKNSSYNKLVQTPPDELWGSELVQINPGYKAFTDFSFDPSLN